MFLPVLNAILFSDDDKNYGQNRLDRRYGTIPLPSFFFF